MREESLQWPSFVPSMATFRPTPSASLMPTITSSASEPGRSTSTPTTCLTTSTRQPRRLHISSRPLRTGPLGEPSSTCARPPQAAACSKPSRSSRRFRDCRSSKPLDSTSRRSTSSGARAGSTSTPSPRSPIYSSPTSLRASTVSITWAPSSSAPMSRRASSSGPLPTARSPSGKRSLAKLSPSRLKRPAVPLTPT